MLQMQLTQIQAIPGNSAWQCNFVQSPQKITLKNVQGYALVLRTQVGVEGFAPQAGLWWNTNNTDWQTLFAAKHTQITETQGQQMR